MRCSICNGHVVKLLHTTGEPVHKVFFWARVSVYQALVASHTCTLGLAAHCLNRVWELCACGDEQKSRCWFILS